MNRILIVIGLLSLLRLSWAQPQNTWRPDDRFKTDLLVVVAHPDDESEIGSYLARLIFDEHKRVAVVFGTRGNSGGNAVGQEQAASLGAIREIEGRRALAYLGVMNVWFLDAPDTPGQDVLRSLATWDHGRSLGRLVRIVRLTRPSIIATWLPDYVAGENHGDHQAAGVIATEAFDIAGDPTQYPEQVTPPRNANDISNLTEGLHPWQVQKLYYFSDADVTHTEFMKGQGPQYSAADVSPSKKVTYARLSAEECTFHLTQSDSGYAARVALEKNQVEKTYFQEPSRFIFGKAHVSSSISGDLWEGVRENAMSFMPPPGFHPQPVTRLTVALGGPWHYYQQFWEAHGLQHLARLVPPEVMAGVGTRVMLPVLVENGSAQAVDGEIRVGVPEGWEVYSGAGPFHAGVGETVAKEITVIAPKALSNVWRDIKITANAAGKPIGSLGIRTQVVQWSLPQ
ncbi:MAG: PIG-L family deacetylase [Acidobacteriaceae bacterium]|nr:PIG-L family deacetylase [Acidobacteriaceae bacterium]